MDYYGLLFLYYLKGLSGKSILRLFFNIEAGGTEQLLPENTSTPTTTPILADIQYPDGLRTDQYFTYRETPTTVSNKARIKTIKGNTLVWNQLVEKGNMTDGWTFSNSTGSYANNILTFTASAQGGFVRPNNPQSIVANHKYLAMVDVKGTSSFTTTVNFTSRNSISIDVTTNWQTFSLVFTNTIAEKNYFPRIYDYRQSGWDAIQIRNCMLIDLTQMGLDITDPSDFTSLFPLSYYSYNQGSLLSFNGNGIKTTGKNFVTNFLADSTTANISWTQENGVIHSFGLSNGTTRTPTYTYAIPLKKGTYVLSGCDGGSEDTYGLRVQKSVDGAWESVLIIYDGEGTFTLDEDAEVRVAGRFSNRQTTNYDVTFYPMIRYANASSGFESYTESTLSLPISTYFPTGMKSAGSVYDELTPRKAITRIGAVDLGTLNWQLERADYNVFLAGVQSYIKPPVDNNTVANIKCAIYSSNTNNNVYGYNVDKAVSVSSGGALRIRDTSFADANTLKTSLSGVYLYYELATPTETPITTEDANEALSLLMGKSVSSSNAKQMIDIITKGE